MITSCTIGNTDNTYEAWEVSPKGKEYLVAMLADDEVFLGPQETESDMPF